MTSIRHILFILFFTCSQAGASLCVYGQTPVAPVSEAARLDMGQRRLLLQSASAYLNVVSYTQVDLDSGVVIAAHDFGIGRSPVIAEGFDPAFMARYGAWVDNDDLQSARKALSAASGEILLGQEILLGAYYAFGQDRDPRMRDSAFYYLGKARRENAGFPAWARKTSILLEKVYFEAGDTTKGLACLREALTTCRRSGDKAGEARALNYEGAFYPFAPDVLTRRIQALDQALPIYRELKDTANECLCLRYKSYMLIPAENPEMSAAVDSQAIRLEQAYHFPYLHYAQDLLNYVSIATDTRKETLTLALAALHNAEALGDTLVLPYMLGRVGQYYITELEKYGPVQLTSWETDAENYMTKTIHILEARNERWTMYNSLGLLLEVLDMEGKQQECQEWLQRIVSEFPASSPIEAQLAALAKGMTYQRQHEYALAERYFLQTLALEPQAKKVRGGLREIYFEQSLGDLYFEIKQYAKARPCYVKCLTSSASRTMTLSSRRDLSAKLAIIDSTAGNYASALRYMSQYAAYADSVHHLSEVMQLDSIRTVFATEQKEIDNELLRAKDAAQQRELDRGALVRKFSFGGLVLLLAVILLVVNRYRLKHRSNQLLQQQKTEIDSKNMELEKLLASKEWLLSEIHHRVKNNLQIMMNLLNMQAGAVQNEEAAGAIRESQNRLHAMSMIHQRLYQTADKQLVEMESYIKEFVYAMHDNFYRGSSVRLDLRLMPLYLDITQAIPLALILNEAVTNVYKYAFAGNVAAAGARVLLIAMHWLEGDDLVELRIQDNGTGLPEPIKASNGTSLGMSLMRGLADQIHGELRIESNSGVCVSLRFHPLTSPL